MYIFDTIFLDIVCLIYSEFNQSYSVLQINCYGYYLLKLSSTKLVQHEIHHIVDIYIIHE